MSDSSHCYQLLSHSPSSQSLPSSSSHSLLTFHNISSSVPSTALDIQHVLQLFSHFWCDVLPCCCDPHWIIHSHFLVHKVLEPANNFKGMCSGFLCCVCGLISPVHGSFYGFCGLVQVLFLGLVVNFSFSICHLPVTTLELDWLTGIYFKKLLFNGAQWLRITQSKGLTRLGPSLSKNKQPASSCFFKKLDHGHPLPTHTHTHTQDCVC
jgi:hypothetical protein